MPHALSVVLATFAFALGSTRYISFITFTVLLLTKALLAFATFKMLCGLLVHLFFKSLGVALQDLDYCLSTLFGEVLSIHAHALNCCDTLIALAFRSTSSFVTQALAIQFQTLCVFALASHTLAYSIGSHAIEELFLVDCLLNYLVCHYLDFLFVLLIDGFLLMS